MPDTHFAHLEDRFLHGQGRRFRVTCSPCRWTSQWHRNKAEANADYARHSTAPTAFAEPTDIDLIQYGLNPAFVVKTQERPGREVKPS
jgi:hypothetical protein